MNEHEASMKRTLDYVAGTTRADIRLDQFQAVRRRRVPSPLAAAAAFLIVLGLAVPLAFRFIDQSQGVGAQPTTPSPGATSTSASAMPILVESEVDVSNAVAPFDHESNVDSLLLEFSLANARNQRVFDCMADAGFEQQSASVLPDREDPILMANATFPDIETLARDGFPNLAGTPASPGDSGQRSEAEAAASRACAEEIDRSESDAVAALGLYSSMRGAWEVILDEIDATDEIRSLVDGFGVCLRDRGIPAEFTHSETAYLGYVDSLLMATGIDQSTWPEIRESTGKLYAECGRDLFAAREALRSGPRREAFLSAHDESLSQLWDLLLGLGFSRTTDTTAPVDQGLAPIPEVATLHPVRITCAGAVSAELSESYPCSALIDGDPTTTWQVPDGGTGVTVTFMFAEPVQITELVFENEPGDAFIRNARVRGVEVSMDDLTQTIVTELSDTNDAPGQIDIRSLRTSVVTIEITSVYPGQSFSDLALGEITIWGRLSPVEPVTPTTSHPVATTGESNWLGTGESISDEEFLAFRPGHKLIPGTAIRLAWTPAYNGEYDLGLFAFMAVPFEQVSSESVWYCLTGVGLLTGSDAIVVGSNQCSYTLEHLQEQLTFGSAGGGTCVEPLTLLWIIWGIPEPVDTVTFDMSDGTELVGKVTDGIVQVAWGRDIVITSVTFAGITEAQTAKLRELYDYAQTCAELNGPAQGGG